MIGKRVPDGEYPTEPGSYSKHTSDGTESWLIVVPTGGPACIIGKPNSDGSDYHWVRENDDGTITVEQQPADAPLDRRNSNSIQWNGWHGYIHDGVWTAC
jgi:hypothetical protein